MERSDLSNPVNKIKEKIINSMFVIMTLMGIPVMIAVIFRSRNTGWLTFYTLQLILMGVALSILPFLNRLGKNLKASIIIAIFSYVIFAGLFSFGNFGAGKLYIIPATLIGGLLIHRRVGYILLILYMLYYSVIAWLYITDSLSYGFEINSFVKAPPYWITIGLGIVLTSLGLLVITDKFELAYQEFFRILKEREENYRALFEQAAEGILIGDRSGTILEANKNVAQLTGYDEDELVGNRINFLFEEEELKREPLRYDLIHKGDILLRTRRLRCKDGHYITIEMRSRQLSDGRLQAFMRDVSAREEAERKIRESERKYRTLFDNASDAIFLVKDMKFFDCNPVALKMFGCRAEDILGKNPSYFSPEYQPDGSASEEVAAKLMLKAFEGQPQFFEWKHCKLNGEEFDAEVSLNKYALNNEFYIQGIVRDITEKKQLTKKLYLASLSAEENERERLARELHDGLGPLLSTSKIYLHNLKDLPDCEVGKADLGKLEQTLDEALTGIKEISNNISPHVLRNFGLSQAIQNYIRKLNPIIPIRLECMLDDKKRYPEALELTIYRILNELLHNSLKYAGASHIRITLEENGDKLTFRFDEDGAGFDYAKAIESKKGYGLLNIESRIKSLNGKYSYRTEPGKGVEVFIELLI